MNMDNIMKEIYNQYLLDFEEIDAKIKTLSDLTKSDNLQSIKQMFAKYRSLLGTSYTKRSIKTTLNVQEHPIFQYGILENEYAHLKSILSK